MPTEQENRNILDRIDQLRTDSTVELVAEARRAAAWQYRDMADYSRLLRLLAQALESSGSVVSPEFGGRTSGLAREMQWRKADGTTGKYSGELFPLGHGIPRKLPPHGIRRAIFDLAFGYVSGFPLSDILAFSVRSLRTVPILSASPETTEPGGSES